MPQGAGQGQNVGLLPYFDFVAAGGIRVSQTHDLSCLCSFISSKENIGHFYQIHMYVYLQLL